MMKDTQSERGRTLDHLLKALSHPTRRRILAALSERNPRDEDEFEAVEFRSDDGDRAAFEAQLYHQHLPHLADAGFITWDTETNTVTRGPNFEEIAPLLRLMADHQDELPDGWP